MYWVKVSRVFVVQIFGEAQWGPEDTDKDREDLSYITFEVARAPGERPLKKK